MLIFVLIYTSITWYSSNNCFIENRKKYDLLTHWLTYNLKSRDASSSKNKIERMSIRLSSFLLSDFVFRKQKNTQITNTLCLLFCILHFWRCIEFNLRFWNTVIWVLFKAPLQFSLSCMIKYILHVAVETREATLQSGTDSSFGWHFSFHWQSPLHQYFP